MLSTFERFVTVERIMVAVKWGCVNMPGVEEYDVGHPTSVSENQKAERVKTENGSPML